VGEPWLEQCVRVNEREEERERERELWKLQGIGAE